MADREKKGKTEISKFEYLENEKSFLYEMKNILHNFWSAIIWSLLHKTFRVQYFVSLKRCLVHVWYMARMYTNVFQPYYVANICILKTWLFLGSENFYMGDSFYWKLMIPNQWKMKIELGRRYGWGLGDIFMEWWIRIGCE